MTTLANGPDKYVSHNERELRRAMPEAQLLLLRAQGLYADVCDELTRANPEDNKYCLLLSNCADNLDEFISGMDTLGEAAE